MAAKNDSTHTIRLPKGMADQVRAATGQDLSLLCRTMLTALLDRYRAEAAAKEQSQ